MKSDLASFQDAFIEALFQRPAIGHEDVFEQPGFAVYRNSVSKACIDALQANYPSTERLVGAGWFSHAAHQYMAQALPADGRMVWYGDGFADFLNSLPSASELPYLADVARLDRLWIESFAAQIEPALDVAALAAVPPEALGTLVLQPRPSARWQWFETLPIFTLWYYNRDGRELPDPIQWQGEGALLIGDMDGVAAHPVSEASALFLDACRRQLSLDQACEFVQRAYPDTDFNHLLGRLLAARAFAAIDPSSRTA